MPLPAIAFAWVLTTFSPAQPALTYETLQAHLGDTSGERVKVKFVNPEMVRVAQTFINYPMGTEKFAVVHGKRYVFVLEQHYHPPGFVGAPTGYHKGVTMYELVGFSPASPGSGATALR
jgi:hypothetical protein